MDLNELQKNWDEFGKTDPLWAILTNPGRKGGKWTPEEFFASGRGEIAAIMNRAEALGFPVRREAALDFGCGVGRLTQALCAWFERCCGVDIAPSMIELARGYNTHGGRCEYLLNAHDDLRVFPDDSFDLVYSSIVLQHMEPRYGTSYMREFVRVLRPGGLVVFQIPDRRLEDPAQAVAQAAQGPMPDGGFRAKFSGYADCIRAAAGAKTAVPATIQNGGECAWPSVGNSEGNFVVQLGNHWLTPRGEPVVWDDGRQPLPFDVPPHAQLRMTVTVTAPPVPGSYVIELDMVQEGVMWFKERFSGTALVQAEIEPAPMEEPKPDDPPHMEMYCVEKDKVIDVLTSGGAKVLDIVADGSPGQEWVSFRYFATKP